VLRARQEIYPSHAGKAGVPGNAAVFSAPPRALASPQGDGTRLVTSRGRRTARRRAAESANVDPPPFRYLLQNGRRARHNPIAPSVARQPQKKESTTSLYPSWIPSTFGPWNDHTPLGRHAALARLTRRGCTRPWRLLRRVSRSRVGCGSRHTRARPASQQWALSDTRHRTHTRRAGAG